MAESLVACGILRPNYFDGQAMLDVSFSDGDDSARRLVYADAGNPIEVGVELLALAYDELLA